MISLCEHFYLQILKDQVTQAKKGEVVPEDEIPPAVFVKSVLQKPLSESKPFPSAPSHLADQAIEKPSTPVRIAAEAPVTVPISDDNSPVKTHADGPKGESMVVAALFARRDEYRHAALEAKKADNKQEAYRCMVIAKVSER